MPHNVEFDMADYEDDEIKALLDQLDELEANKNNDIFMPYSAIRPRGEKILTIKPLPNWANWPADSVVSDKGYIMPVGDGIYPSVRCEPFIDHEYPIQYINPCDEITLTFPAGADINNYTVLKESNDFMACEMIGGKKYKFCKEAKEWIAALDEIEPEEPQSRVEKHIEAF